MSIPLLANSVTVPYTHQRLQYWLWINPSTLIEFCYEANVTTLIAVCHFILSCLATTLFLMRFWKTILMKWYCMRQALHHCIEETCVSMIAHRKSHLLQLFLFQQALGLHLQLICSLIRHDLEGASVTSFRQCSRVRLRQLALLFLDEFDWTWMPRSVSANVIFLTWRVVIVPFPGSKFCISSLSTQWPLPELIWVLEIGVSSYAWCSWSDSVVWLLESISLMSISSSHVLIPKSIIFYFMKSTINTIN